MRVVLLSVVLLLCGTLVAQAYEDQNLEDDDFAEFEQFEVDDEDESDNGKYLLNNQFITMLVARFFLFILFKNFKH